MLGDLFKFACLIVLLFILMRPKFLMNMFRKTSEPFDVLMLDETVTTRSVFDSDPSRMCQLSKSFQTSFADDTDVMFLRSCVMMRDTDEDMYPRMEKMLKSSVKYFVQPFEFRTKHFNDVRNRIKEELGLFGNQVGGTIQGPVFALVFQAPYYRDFDSANQTIHIQPYNIHEYQFRPYLLHGRDEKDEKKNFVGNLMIVYMIYPMYTQAKQKMVVDPAGVEKYVAGCLNWFLKQSSLTETVCKMRCPSDSMSFCGCMNTRESKGAPYTSVCLGPKDKDDFQKSTFVNYGILYRINEQNAMLKQHFSSTYIHDSCDAK